MSGVLKAAQKREHSRELQLNISAIGQNETEAIDDGPQDRMAFAHDIEVTVSKLPEHLRSICIRLKTQTVSDVAREMGMARATFYDKVVNPLRSYFEDAGLREYL